LKHRNFRYHCNTTPIYYTRIRFNIPYCWWTYC